MKTRIYFLFFSILIFQAHPLTAQTMKAKEKNKSVKVAMIQMKVVGGNMEDNLRQAEKMVADAAAHGADIALLPECMDLGWTHPSSLSKATAIPDGEVFSRLSALAKK